MTLEQAKKLTYDDELHYIGRRPCKITIGPRGGYTESITRARVSGAVKTWKRSPNRVRVPVKHGLYESGYIDEHNLEDWHLACDCCATRDYEQAAANGAAIARTFTHKGD